MSTCLAFQTTVPLAVNSKTRLPLMAPMFGMKIDDKKNTLVEGSPINGLGLKKVTQQSQKTTEFFSADKTTGMASANSSPVMKVENDMERIDIDQKDKIVMLGLLWVTACLSALDRVAMSVALVPMTAEFGLTDTIKGSISSFFSVGYGLGIVPAGIILSFASPRIVMSVAVVSWSLATLATPWAAESLAVGTTASSLLFMRACVGAAESLVMPTLQRLLLAWTKPEEKAMGIATVVSGFQAGTIAAYLVSPIVMDVFSDGAGWRQLFYVYGSFGLALLLPWLLVAKDGPDRAPYSRPEPTSEPSAAPTSNFESAIQVFKDAPWTDFVRSKGCWAMLLAHCSKNWYVFCSPCDLSLKWCNLSCPLNNSLVVC